MERADMGGGVPKICQGISFSKHRMLETLQEVCVDTHITHIRSKLLHSRKHTRVEL